MSSRLPTLKWPLDEWELPYDSVLLVRNNRARRRLYEPRVFSLKSLCRRRSTGKLAAINPMFCSSLRS